MNTSLVLRRFMEEANRAGFRAQEHRAGSPMATRVIVEAAASYLTLADVDQILALAKSMHLRALALYDVHRQDRGIAVTVMERFRPRKGELV